MTTQETLENVEKALSEIRPFLESDGGNIKLLSIEDEVVKVQLEGFLSSKTTSYSSNFNIY